MSSGVGSRAGHVAKGANMHAGVVGHHFAGHWRFVYFIFMNASVQARHGFIGRFAHSRRHSLGLLPLIGFVEVTS